MTLMIIALAIFGVTYLFIITEWINKMLAALLGGFLVVVLGIVEQSKAFLAVDWNVIFLLIGMMMVMSVLRETGLFQYLAIKTAKFAKAQPLRIILLMFIITGVISAFLDNVTTVMILVPIALLIAQQLAISPLPFIITMAIASNIGGTATMIGDPPNILIGSATDYSFMDFIYNLTPVIALITIVSVFVTYLLYHKVMKVTNENRARLMSFEEKNMITDRRLLAICLVVVFLMLLGFALQDVLHLEVAAIAMVSGLFLLVINNRKHVDKVLMNSIDWGTIFFFIGLFMIVESLIETGFIDLISRNILQISGKDMRITSVVILWFSGIFSAVIDNVPFVTTMIPLIKSIGTHFPAETMHPIWWSLALGACLGGNGTMIGASANIVSLGIAHKNGVKISFMDFTKIGLIYTVISLAISTFYILLRYY